MDKDEGGSGGDKHEEDEQEENEDKHEAAHPGYEAVAGMAVAAAAAAGMGTLTTPLSVVLWRRGVEVNRLHKHKPRTAHPRALTARATQCTAQIRQEDATPASRRVMLASLLSVTALPLLAAAEANATPFEESKVMQLGTRDGRLRPCPSAANPNCISTSSTDASYAPPWETPSLTTEEAVVAIKQAVFATCKNATFTSTQSSEAGTYLQFKVDGRYGPDAIEFLIKDDPQQRTQHTVLFRSLATKVIFVYPFQTAISDFGEQKKRLTKLRQQLDWRLLGCDVIECFE
eukprot:jgi/Chlat1/7769/Chrsp66S07241